MTRFLVSFCLSFFVLSQYSSAYASERADNQKIISWMKELATKNAIISFSVEGYSENKKPVGLLKIRKYPNKKPFLFFNGAHHGNETVSGESVIALASYISERQDSPEVDKILKHFDLLIIPVVNPDGWDLNSRYNARGYDVNRDYSFSKDKSLKTFETAEAQVVRNIFENFDVFGALAFHAGTESVLWPLCFSPQKTKDHNLFFTLARNTAKRMKLPSIAQSFFDYPSEGEFVDFAYLNYGTFALTLEISTDPNPKEKSELFLRAINGSLGFANDLIKLRKNELKIVEASNAPSKLVFSEDVVPESRTASN